MADLGISVAAKLIEVLTGESINHILDMWGYKAELEDLKKTVSFIRNVLVDADREAAIRKLSRQEEDYIEELKYAVYDVDDVFDEFQTLAELKQLGDLSKVGKLMDKVNRFFSSKNQIGEAYRMSSEVTNIRNKLKTIADHKKFKFKNVNHEFNRREETCSILKTMQVIGRENDKKMIIDMLLDHQNVGENVSFVTIFGEGGLGKTVLAQFVYDDEKIKNEFKHDTEKTIKNGFSGDFRLWVCVGDLDKEKFDVKAILCKIIELVNKESVDVNKSLELVQRQFQENFRDKKYFLVLDDVWSEDCNKWDSLKNVLRFCARGSRVLVTTRSEKTAKMIGWKHVHKLGGLSEDNAWHLFKGLAFEERDETHQELVEIGKKIVHKFHGNPLALSVLGSYLSGADIDKWRTIEEFGFVGLSRNDGDKIFSTLRFSYDNLEPRLKNCFSYFALFRKDFRIEKERLISLWIAQGYIVPDKGQSFDDAAEEHFVTLLQRRFFEIELGSPFNLIKVHDFMHDLAQDVRKNEIVNSLNSNLLADQVRHVRNTCLDSLRCSPKIRSYIGKFHKDVDIGNWKYLRVLDLSYSKFKSLPKSIGKLLLLRYLDLSYNDELYALSNEITKLHNLQTLLLSGCSSIREFPKGSGKLIKLRHLDLGRCRKFVKEGPLMDVLLVNWRYLGVLNMSGLNGESLSISIGKLMHLRHLDLSENVYLKAVPDEISELCNLQSLLLRNCYHLRCLPKDFSKLSKLRQFDLDDCISLTCMPLGMEKLTSLTFLPYFVVGRRNSAKMDCDDELKVLKPLTKVKGSIKIVIGEYYRKVESLDDIEEGYLRRIEHLEEVDLKFDFACENPKAALETLKPHSNLKKLKLSSYRGTTIPWGRAKDNWAISLSGLVSISLKDCTHLQEMPMLSKLPHLKRLNLEKLDRLEFMETSSNDTEREELPMFFPSLEYLEIRSISELKGWWEGKPSWVDYDYHSKKILRFSCLVELRISSCMKLTSFPQCPRLEALELSANNETLKIRTDEEEEVLLRELTIGDLGILKSLPISRLTKLIVKTRGRRLYYTKGVDDLSQEFSRCASFLKSLSIEDMDVLRILSGRKGFHNFTALESLNIAVSATMYVEYEDDDIFWKSLSQNLRILNFESGSRMKDGLPKGFRYLTSLQTLQLECGDGVKAIPEWIDCLSSLQYLSIRDCPELKSLPEKMKKLDSLKSLEIKSCPKLEERCRKPDGADWPKIRHIPNIQINNTKIQ